MRTTGSGKNVQGNFSVQLDFDIFGLCHYDHFWLDKEYDCITQRYSKVYFSVRLDFDEFDKTSLLVRQGTCQKRFSLASR